MNTGLPPVLGWEHHVKQRGNAEPEIIERREAIRRIYSATDAAAVERLLRRFHVGWVYVGWLERKTYPPAGLRKFDAAKDLFELAYENREAKVYRVVGGDSEDVIAPARESLPETPASQEVKEEEEEPPAISEEPEEGRPPFAGMREPRDGDVDGRGRLWIADFGNSRLRIFDREGGFLGGWGGRSSTTYGLREPCSVSIRGDDVYIADTWNGRVQHFTLSGEWKSSAGELYGPRGVAAAPDGKVWVTDTGNHRVIAYDRDLGNKQIIGKHGKGPLEFSSPVGIASDDAGSIYVADTGNRRIQVLSGDGAFLGSIPVRGWKGAVEPHIEIAPDGGVYSTDPEANVVIALDRAGAETRRWAADDQGMKFSKPTGLALDRKNAVLYVINSGSNTILKLQLPEMTK
jgi:sugar lactone lactonase YvrE